LGLGELEDGFTVSEDVVQERGLCVSRRTAPCHERCLTFYGNTTKGSEFDFNGCVPL
jgi:hypothetical protein